MFVCHKTPNRFFLPRNVTKTIPSKKKKASSNEQSTWAYFFQSYQITNKRTKPNLIA